MRIVRSSAPVSQILTLTNVKNYLNINYEDSDAVLKLLINQATEVVERQTGLLLREASYCQFWDYNEISNVFQLIYRPASSISYVRTFNTANENTTVDSSTYYLETEGNRVYFDVMPSENYRPIDSLKIKYVVSPDGDYLPADLIMATYDLIAYYFDNRGNPDKIIPQSIINTINSHKCGLEAIGGPNSDWGFNIGNRYYLNVDKG